MAVPRFQVISLARSARVPSARLPAITTGSGAIIPPSRPRGFAWRFMSANNRSLAKSAHASPDVESCLESIRSLQNSLPETVAETSRNGNGQWVWQIRLADEVIAIATRSYPRRVRARLTCAAFLRLVTETAASTPVQPGSTVG